MIQAIQPYPLLIESKVGSIDHCPIIMRSMTRKSSSREYVLWTKIQASNLESRGAFRFNLGSVLV